MSDVDDLDSYTLVACINALNQELCTIEPPAIRPLVARTGGFLFGVVRIPEIQPIGSENRDRPDSPVSGDSLPRRVRKLFPESWLWSNVTAL